MTEGLAAGIGGRSNSLKWPHLYDLLRAKGYDKSKSAAISNSRVAVRGKGKLRGLPRKHADNPKKLAMVLKKYNKKHGITASALIAACHSAACAPPPAGTGGSSESGSVQTGSKPGYVPISNYGVNYDPKSASVVSSAEALDARGQIDWDKIETKMLPVSEIGTLRADEREVKESSINKVVSGRERLREGYTIKLVESPSGSLHILDGHHRVAMHA